MIKVVLFVLLVYCIFAWGYGLSLMIDIFNEIKEEKLKYIEEGKPIFLVPPILFLLWIVFPLLWPVCEIFVKDEEI